MSKRDSKRLLLKLQQALVDDGWLLTRQDLKIQTAMVAYFDHESRSDLRATACVWTDVVDFVVTMSRVKLDGTHPGTAVQLYKLKASTYYPVIGDDEAAELIDVASRRMRAILDKLSDESHS